MIEASKTVGSVRKLTYGMVGGGPGAFIGDVHRTAIRMDDLARLAAGCFSRDAHKGKAFGRSLGLDEDRVYADFTEMARKEAMRKDRIDFVVVVTPNSSHYAICKAFLEQGIHVVSDKPLTVETAQAEELVKLAKQKDLLFGVTYTYTGYPVVKQIAALVRSGEIGEIRFVNAEYPQEWLATRSEDGDNRQAAWRTDPAQSGKSNCVGDIGSHVENMVATMTGLKIKRLSARLDTFVPGRVLDDNASIMVEYEGGAKGLYWSSQIAIGYDNALRVRLFGSKGTIEWFQEDPDHFRLVKLGEPARRISRGRDGFVPAAQAFSRIPSGHVEGVFEAFANIYKAYANALAKKIGGGALTQADIAFPTVQEGLDGVRFIGACVASSASGSQWIDL